MGKFDRNDRGGFKKFGGGARPMFQAVCSKCGNDCEVPFKPTGDRPVFCKNCFTHEGKTSGERNFDGGFSGNFNKRESSDRPMFQATCARCGNRCDVPFKPTGSRPVYCKSCFDKGDNPGASPTAPAKTPDQYKAQLEVINTKLDRILRALQPVQTPADELKELLAEPKAAKPEKAAKKTKAKISAKKVKAKKK